MARRWWALVAVALATFMTYLDNNVTNVAIPTIQRSLPGAHHARDHHGDLPRRTGAHGRDRDLDRDRGHGAGLRPADRRLHQSAPALELDLLHQRAGRHHR